MKKIIDFFLYALPLIVAVTVFFLNDRFLLVTKELPGVEKIIESIINYTSIIIGVLIALFGIVVALTDKDIMKKLQKNNKDNTIFRYCVETLISNFLLLAISIILQSIVQFRSQISYTQLILNLWISIVFFATASSIRTIYYLLLISFNQNDHSVRPESKYTITADKRKEIMQIKSKVKK